MAYLTDPEGLDRVTFKKGPGSVHDRVLRIAYEATPPEELPDEPLSVYSRFGVDFADGSLESLDFVLRIEREFDHSPRARGLWDWLIRFTGTSRLFDEFEAFYREEWLASYNDPGFEGKYFGITIGHIVHFLEGREQG
jgi:hypothetical protein